MKIGHVVMSLRYGGIQEIMCVLIKNMLRHEHVVFTYELGVLATQLRQIGVSIIEVTDSEVAKSAHEVGIDVLLSFTVNGTSPSEHLHAYEARDEGIPIVNYAACCFPCQSPRELFASVIVPSTANREVLGWNDVELVPPPLERPDRSSAIMNWRKKLKLSDQTLLLGRCSRLEDSKLVVETIECLQALQALIRQEIHLVIAGSESQWLPEGFKPGDYISWLKEAAAHSGLGGFVHVTGPLEVNEKWNLLHSLDLCLAPTVMEGFGYILAEPLSVGVPVVSFDHMANSETIGPGGQAVPLTLPKNRYEVLGSDRSRFRLDYREAISRDDVNRLAMAAAAVLKESDLRKRLGTVGQRHIEALTSVTSCSDRIEKILFTACRRQ